MGYRDPGAQPANDEDHPQDGDAPDAVGDIHRPDATLPISAAIATSPPTVTLSTPYAVLKNTAR